jgi:hypothetical protein
MTTYDDDFYREANCEMSQSDDDFYPEANREMNQSYDDDFHCSSEPENEIGKWDYDEGVPETNNEAKRNGDVALPFLRLALRAMGNEYRDEPIERLIVEAFKNLNIKHAMFVDNKLILGFTDDEPF